MSGPNLKLPRLVFAPTDGTSASVVLDMGEMIVSRLLVQANSGGGKSRALRYLAEQTHGRVQHIIFDREGEFSTLRERLPYLLVGPDGDVAADVRTAPLLARKVMELRVSVVLDLSGMSLRTQREYVKAYLDALNHLPRALWQDCLVIIDEAHLFAPEAGKGDPLALEAIAMLLSTGRKRGYCAVLATQRVSKLSKDVSAECLNKLIGRTSQEDIKRAGDELGIAPADARGLRSLTPGEFWAYGPAVSAEPVLVRTGAVTTKPPARGSARGEVSAAPSEIAAALAELADLPKQADDEQRTLDGLRRRVAELEREVEAGGVREVERLVEVPVIDVEGLNDAVFEERQRVRANVLAALASLQTDMAEAVTHAIDSGNPMPRAAARAAGRDIRESFPFSSDGARAQVEAVKQPQRAPLASTLLPRSHTSKLAPGMQLSGPAQRMINAMAFLDAMNPDSNGHRGQTIAALVGVSSTTGTWSNRLSELRVAGMIEDVGRGVFRLTSEGRQHADRTGLPASQRELHEQWLQKLSGPAARMLAILIRHYPNPVSKQQLAAMLDVSHATGTFSNRLSELRSPGLIVDPDRSSVAASPTLFPRGLPR